jgi:hypothetical protein
MPIPLSGSKQNELFTSNSTLCALLRHTGACRTSEYIVLRLVNELLTNHRGK